MQASSLSRLAEIPQAFCLPFFNVNVDVIVNVDVDDFRPPAFRSVSEAGSNACVFAGPRPPPSPPIAY